MVGLANGVSGSRTDNNRGADRSPGRFDCRWSKALEGTAIHG
jgi:hypothetical protein